MLTGRKLLLADDSAAIRKVIELTFSDEGMEVITVPDGRAAFEKMLQVRPDLVLADVYMPEIDGLELCRSIKQDERFAKTPVMLLISSFEPFDEAEARRAGADDVVTKPFQSIRQLVSRVGSLLNKGDSEPPVTDEYPTMQISHNEPIVSAPMEELPSAPQVTVLVEAPMMEHSEPAGVTCSTDVELQTADTMKLERIVDEPADEPVNENLSVEDTIEVEPVEAIAIDDQIQSESQRETIELSYSDIREPVDGTPASGVPHEQSAPETSEPSAQSPAPSPMKFDDAVLDLEDEFLGEPQMVGEDVFLDLDFADNMPAETPPEIVAQAAPVVVAEEAPAVVTEEVSAPVVFAPTSVVEEAAELEHPASTELHEAPVFEMQEEPSPVSPAFSEPSPEPLAEPPSAPLATAGVEGLSPAAIEAIARRMVEQMSDKVIREIAWEVVPELSELLIKQKIEEQK